MQTIERMKSQMDGVGSEETVSDHGPVLEEFMQLNPSLSPSSSEERDASRKEEAADTPPQAKKATPDWLQSVQLWSKSPSISAHHRPLTRSCRASRGRVPAVREGEARRAAGLVNHGRGELNRGRGQQRQGCCFRRQQEDNGEQGQGGPVVGRPEAAAVLGPGPPPPFPAGAAAARRVPRGDAEADPGGGRAHQRRSQEPFAEVTSAHEAGELDGPERQRQRDAAIRRGRRHLGAAAGVRRPQQQHSLRRSSYPLTRRDVPTRYTLRWPRCRQERNRSRSS